MCVCVTEVATKRTMQFSVQVKPASFETNWLRVRCEIAFRVEDESMWRAPVKLTPELRVCVCACG